MSEFKVGQQVYIESPGDAFHGRWAEVIQRDSEAYYEYVVKFSNSEISAYHEDELRPEVTEPTILHQLRYVGWGRYATTLLGVFSTREKAGTYRDAYVKRHNVHESHFLISEIPLDKEFTE